MDGIRSSLSIAAALASLQESGDFAKALYMIRKNSEKRSTYWPILFTWALEPATVGYYNQLLNTQLTPKDAHDLSRDASRCCTWLSFAKLEAASGGKTNSQMALTESAVAHVLHAYVASCYQDDRKAVDPAMQKRRNLRQRSRKVGDENRDGMLTKRKPSIRGIELADSPLARDAQRYFKKSSSLPSNKQVAPPEAKPSQRQPSSSRGVLPSREDAYRHEMIAMTYVLLGALENDEQEAFRFLTAIVENLLPTSSRKCDSPFSTLSPYIDNMESPEEGTYSVMRNTNVLTKSTQYNVHPRGDSIGRETPGVESSTDDSAETVSPQTPPIEPDINAPYAVSECDGCKSRQNSALIWETLGQDFSEIAKEFMPDVYRLFESAGLPVIVLSYKWFPTLFTDVALTSAHRQLPMRTLLTIWDVCFLMGIEGVMAVALALLMSSYKEIFSKKKAKNADQVGNRLNRAIVQMTPEDILDQVYSTIQTCKSERLLLLRSYHSANIKRTQSRRRYAMARQRLSFGSSLELDAVVVPHGTGHNAVSGYGGNGKQNRSSGVLLDGGDSASEDISEGATLSDINRENTLSGCSHQDSKSIDMECARSDPVSTALSGRNMEEWLSIPEAGRMIRDLDTGELFVLSPTSCRLTKAVS